MPSSTSRSSSGIILRSSEIVHTDGSFQPDPQCPGRCLPSQWATELPQDWPQTVGIHSAALSQLPLIHLVDSQARHGNLPACRQTVSTRPTPPTEQTLNCPIQHLQGTPNFHRKVYARRVMLILSSVQVVAAR